MDDFYPALLLRAAKKEKDLIARTKLSALTFIIGPLQRRDLAYGETELDRNS